MTLLADTGFREYRNRVFRLYGEKKFAEALAVAFEASKKFPDFDAKTAFWIACMQCRVGQFEGAIQTLAKAIDRGVWWPPGTLQDSDLDSIRTRPEFAAVERNCKSLQQHAPKLAKAELMVRLPTNYSDDRDWPALVVFHARYGERPEISVEEWFPIQSNGVILAAPWSSQVYAPDGRCWDDWEQSERDVRWAIEMLQTRYRVDPKKLILGGFSQGAALSIYGALKRVVPSRGFVAVASSDWVRPEQRPAAMRTGLSEPFANFIKSSDCHGIRGVMIMGDKDPFFTKIRQLHTLMVERGLDGKLMVESGIGHEYPKGFEGKLQVAVNFLLETE